MEPDLIVVHGISLPPGEFGGPWIDRLFTNTLPLDAHPYFAEVAPLRVSSHLGIRRDGALTQYVKFTDRAWHAGKSSFKGREACNDFSIGIELEGTDTLAYETRSIMHLPKWSPPCAGRTRTCRPIGWSDIATSRRGVRPTRARLRLGARPGSDGRSLRSN